MEEEKKRCSGCKCMKPVSMFYGMRETNTAKCIVCNKKASRYVHKVTTNKAIAEKNKIVEEFLSMNNIDGSNLKFF
jgi:hypothetical protein